MSFEGSQEESLLASGGCQQTFRASLVAQLVKNPPAMQKILVQFLGQEVPGINRLPTPVFLGFPSGSDGKESTAMQETWV